MTKVCACVFILAGVVLSAQQLAAQQPPTVLTLAQAVDEALTKSDQAINQREAIQQAALGLRLARNTFTPKIVPNVQGSFGQTNVANQTYRLDVAQRFTTGTELRVGVGTSTAQIPSLDPAFPGDVHFYDTDTTLTLSQPLLRGFGPSVARRGLTSAELRRADAVRQQIQGDQRLAVQVASAYYQVVAQQALTEVARQSFERARKLRDAAEANLAAGRASQLDVLRAQQLVSQAEIQYFDSQSAVEDAKEQLSFIIGRDSDSPFSVVTEIPKVVEPMEADQAAALALEKRLDLQAAISLADDAERAISYNRNQLLPQLDVNFSLTRRQTAQSFRGSFGLDKFQFATFFTISMPVDRTPQVIEYQNATIERDRRKRELDTMRKRIGDDARRAVRDRDRVLRTLTAAETSVAITTKEVEVAQFRYDRGLSNFLDVITAEADLLGAESRRISTLASLAVARLSLRATLGILDPRKDIVEKQ